MSQSSNHAILEKQQNGHYLLKGQLNFNSVPPLWKKNRLELFGEDNHQQRLIIDLALVERSDSSGLAMLVEWYREAEQCQKTIEFKNLPAQMMDIAKVSGLSDILPMA